MKRVLDTIDFPRVEIVFLAFSQLLVLLAITAAPDLTLLFWFEGKELLVILSDGIGVVRNVEDFVFEHVLLAGHV
jgi:hypothetical protein